MTPPDDDLDFGQTIRGFVEGQKVFDRYVLKGILGRGGMGIVWLAWDEKLERDIALKFMPDLVRLDAAAVDDLKRETRKSLSLTHPNIVRIHDYVDDAQSAAISMEYIEGATLSALRVEKPERVFEVEELREWISQVCTALAYAHEEVRVVHRDLKPANLMVTSAGKIKVTDFGIARSICDSASRMSMAAGSSSGTLVYMSPQQLDGGDPSASDDVYSLGATLYELLTSRPPFTSGSIYTQIKEKVPPSMTDRRAALEISGQPIPAVWEATVAACLAKDPAERPQGAQQMLDMLMGRGEVPALAAEEAPPPTPETPSPAVEPEQPPPLPGKVPPKESRSVKKPLLIGFALLVVVVVALFGLSKLQKPSIAKAPASPTPETSSSLFSSMVSGDNSALALLQDRADSGEAEAQYNLGVLYAAGEGVAQDDAMAAEWFRKAADQGNAEAQFSLGLSYERGEGVAEDDVMAIKWYRLAAEQGNAASQNNLGYMYFVGKGVEEDMGESVKWYRLAADQGDADSQNALGDAYSDGFGVEEDESESLKWYRLSADQGYAEAQSNLGFIYENGYGVAKDKSEAIKWYRLAAEQGDGHAENKLKELEEEPKLAEQRRNEEAREARLARQATEEMEASHVFREMDQTEIERLAGQGNAEAQFVLGYRLVYGDSSRSVRRDEPAAEPWLEKATAQGHPLAAIELATILNSSSQTEGNKDRAAKLARDHLQATTDLAKGGDPIAQLYVGFLYSRGIAVEKDLSEAGKWYRLAADQGQATAQYSLGRMYHNGGGVGRDYVEASKWYRLAADQGSARAQARLGYMYESGKGVEVDYAKAIKWYRLAADQGSAIGQNNLGNLYENGRGVRQDATEAVKWYRLAVDQKLAQAQANLGYMYENGLGVQRSESEAKKWYGLAAAQGHEDAKERLKILNTEFSWPQ